MSGYLHRIAATLGLTKEQLSGWTGPLARIRSPRPVNVSVGQTGNRKEDEKLMPTFLETERHRYTSEKLAAPWLSASARRDGEYRGLARSFCVPRERAAENLFEGIRDSALARFAACGIKWHDGDGENPSNHLCDSQVCCVNFLYPFAQQPAALTALLRRVLPDIARPLPMEGNNELVSFEWIGMENYLGERVPVLGSRARGANYTSADAAVLYETTGGTRRIALIEWKYTESYSSTSVATSDAGTDRLGIYRHLYDRDDGPLRREAVPEFADLFYEPFYQLMRQQFLASEMARAREFGAESVSVLHIAPAHNTEFQRVTSPALTHIASRVTDVWTALQRNTGTFLSDQDRRPLLGTYSQCLPCSRPMARIHRGAVSLGADHSVSVARAGQPAVADGRDPRLRSGSRR